MNYFSWLFFNEIYRSSGTMEQVMEIVIFLLKPKFQENEKGKGELL